MDLRPGATSSYVHLCTVSNLWFSKVECPFSAYKENESVFKVKMKGTSAMQWAGAVKHGMPTALQRA